VTYTRNQNIWQKNPNEKFIVTPNYKRKMFFKIKVKHKNAKKNILDLKVSI